MATSTYDPRTGMALPPGYGLPYNPFDNNTWTAATAPAGGGRLPATYQAPSAKAAASAAAKSAAKAGAKAVYQATTPSSATQTITRLFGNRPSWTPVQSFGIIGTGSSGRSNPIGSVTYSAPGNNSGGGFGGSFAGGGGMGNVNSIASRLGGYTDTAMSEMRNKQLASEQLLQAQMGALGKDPNWQAARNLAFNAAQNPGYDKALLDRIRGRTAARAAVSGASAARSVAAQMARGNITGAAGANMLARAQRAAALQGDNAGLDVDKMAADAAMMDRARAITQLASLSQAQNASQQNLAMALANQYSRADPIGALQRIQQLMSPMGAIGYGQALVD